ncbi:MAG: UDP-N-acetylglucosamine--N-acetylmuramyl-(pentapeptide) pyrophosphoryl-undecaprenol N-acetylglucosamine transferase [Candidatus Omnitrophica bacterium]|nr:UDP-N-acetylglucosamine--N-acetylmuramyl-(pentapeptide) pyrophosphoryl-undecaprenol N-acetylglucosamine transferase [Candidatus Omnitrophota bacterium]
MRILVATGSSGGHVFPAISLLTELKMKYADLEALLILPRDCILSGKDIFPCEVRYIPVSPIKFKLDLKNIVAVFNLLKGACKSLFILMEFRPDVVVGFGSLVSIPVIIFAWLMRISTLIHEQNVVIGRSNRFLCAFADRIAVSFPQSRGYFRGRKDKIIYTGNPIRPELTKIDRSKALDFFGLGSDSFTILAMGGSKGSHRINIEFLKAVAGISRGYKFQVIHLCGQGDYDLLNQGYGELDVRARLFSFLGPMHYAYSASDLVLCRCGALTISEIMFFALPAILVPYPHAYAHQSANAMVLAEKGSAVIIKDEELSAAVIKNKAEYFMAHQDELNNMRLSYRDFLITDANRTLAEAVLALAA